MHDIPEVFVLHVPLQVLSGPLELLPVLLADGGHLGGPLLYLLREHLTEGAVKLAPSPRVCFVTAGRYIIILQLEGKWPHYLDTCNPCFTAKRI